VRRQAGQGAQSIMDLADLPAGIYVLTLTGAAGQASYKISKQ
jgi:hypothetical protein